MHACWKHNFSLTQVVSSPTHYSHDGNPSLIDLVFISCPERLLSCETVPPLGSSDHLGVQLAIRRNITHNHPPNQRTIWRYKYADYEKATELLEHVDWSDVLSSDMDTAAQIWEERFLNIMEQCIPKITISSHSNLPWLSNDLKQNFPCKKCSIQTGKTHWSPKPSEEVQVLTE